jgi:cytochrome c
MRVLLHFLVMLAGLFAASVASAEGDPKRGAQIYRACVACHALEPGLHLTGPSLAGMFDSKAGAAAGYTRYSKGLKDAEFAWNAAALDSWLANPAEMIPGTYMTFAGIADTAVRADLVAFLAVAAVPGGGERAVAQGLIPRDYLRAQAPDSAKDMPAEVRVAAMRHCGDGYVVTTQDGTETAFWEKNVRLKIDTQETGPSPGAPVILGAGMQGDRVSVIFASLADLKAIVAEGC